MPELELSATTPNAADHNAKIAQELAAQDAAGQSNVPAESPETFDALDALRKEKETAKQKEGEDAAAAEVKIEPKVDDAAAKKTDDSEKKTDDSVAKVKPQVEVPVENEIFKGIELPPKASPKSSEAFAAVKAKATAELSARDAKIAEQEKQLADAAEKLKNPIPAELSKEVEELRAFRARLDVEADPKFKQYDKQISDTHEFIYSQLTKSGVITKDHIAEIKKYGGPENVNLDKVFETINDPLVKRIVEAKLADVEMLRHQKTQAIEATKTNINEYLKEREQAFSQATGAHNEATKVRYTELTARLDWNKEKTIPADADAATKKNLKEYNEFVVNTRKDLEIALADDSPEMRAIQLAGMGQLLHTQRVLAERTAEKTALEAQLKEATDKLERYKNAGRIRETGAAPAAKPVVKSKDDFSKTAQESLDDARNKILEEKRAAATA